MDYGQISLTLSILCFVGYRCYQWGKMDGFEEGIRRWRDYSSRGDL